MYIEQLNADSVEERLQAVRALGEDCKRTVVQTEEVNNHVHSIYSFSPYSPALIAAKAAAAGLRTVGIMDHDSVAGCSEFLEAAKAVNIAGTAGLEMRVNMDGTSVQGRKTNNPDEPNISYIALHGIPFTRFGEAENFLKTIRKERMVRMRREVEILNKILVERRAPVLDFAADVMAGSEAAHGGSLTERHILRALSLKLMETYGKGAELVDFIEGPIGIPLKDSLKQRLMDVENPYYTYDLTGAFKASLTPAFYQRTEDKECTSVFKAVEWAEEIGAIPAYAYLGDVDESPTDDKTAERFEDAFLGDLVPELAEIGFRAVTYMPPRNTKKQLCRLQKLCRENKLMEISGVDINSPRQSFNCPILLEPAFRHLIDAAWALIAHEKLAASHSNLALFNPDNPMAALPLEERMAQYARIGREMDHTQPEKTVEQI